MDSNAIAGITVGINISTNLEIELFIFDDGCCLSIIGNHKGGLTFDVRHKVLIAFFGIV